MRSMLFSARISGSGAAFLVSAIIIRRHAALVFVAPINRGVLNINKRFMSSRVVQGATSHATTPTLSSTVDSRLAGRIYELVGREFDISKPAVLSKVCTSSDRIWRCLGTHSGITSAPWRFFETCFLGVFLGILGERHGTAVEDSSGDFFTLRLAES